MLHPLEGLMELEQLVSFVRYQRGQKQGWDALDEVLTVVADSKALVDKAIMDVADHQKRVEEMKASLVAMDEAGKVQAANLEAALATIRADHENALKTSKAALQDEINHLIGERAGLEIETTQALAGAVKAQEDLGRLEKAKQAADAELEKIWQSLATLSNSIPKK